MVRGDWAHQSTLKRRTISFAMSLSFSVSTNAALNLATNVLGVSLDPYMAFNFFVEIDGIVAGAFSECTGLQVETELETYAEGGMNDYVHQFAGRTKYPPLTLKHGMTPIDGLWAWHQEIVTERKIIRRNGAIFLLNEMRIPIAWWNFEGAFPYKWVGPELRASAAEVAFESVELVHQGLKRPRTANLLAGIGAELTASVAGGVF